MINKVVHDAELVIKKITSSLEHIEEIPLEINSFKDNENISRVCSICQENYINGKLQDSVSGQFTDLINPTTGEGDPYYPNAYFGNTIKPYDVIFIKTNRGVSTDEIIKLTDQYYIYNTNKTDYIEPFTNKFTFSDYLNLHFTHYYNTHNSGKSMYTINLVPFVGIIILLFIIYLIFKKFLTKSYKRLLKLI